MGGGVIGCSLAWELACRGVEVVLLEAEQELATGASGSNSGILHTGFDSSPGELETRMILRSGELRELRLSEAGVPVMRCGARMVADDDAGREALGALAANAARNGVSCELLAGGELLIPGEAVIDPAHLTASLASGCLAAGGTLRLGALVTALHSSTETIGLELAGGGRLHVGAVANCAGLRADEIAGMAGGRPFEIYPRKGEFLVFDQPPGAPLEEILLPVPSAAGKGVLVFPTIDGHVIAGPTARERSDKGDWSVEPDAAELILAKASSMFEPLAGAEPIAAYAGLRPAGRGVNYVIEQSTGIARMVNVAAIRSTGLSAAFGIAEHAAGLLARASGIALGERRPTHPGSAAGGPPWWRSAAQRSARAPRP